MILMNRVNLLCFLTLLSTLAHLVKLPNMEELATDLKHDPSFLVGHKPQNPRNRDMWYLIVSIPDLSTLNYYATETQKIENCTRKKPNGACLLNISILSVTLSHDVQINPGPRAPKFPCGSCTFHR